MYTCSFIGVEKYIYFLKVNSKVIQFLSKDVIISIEFHFKLVSNYFELYKKSNEIICNRSYKTYFLYY